MQSGNKAFDVWIAKQAIWRDSDLVKAALVGIVIGLVIGFAWGFGVGSPDLSGINHTGVRG